MQRVNNFDLFRFLAASLVLFSHCYPLTGNPATEPIRIWTGIDSGGGLAVAIFFAISGYLITASCIRSKGITDYLIKRALRLFPGLIVCVALTILTMGLLISRLPSSDYWHHPMTQAYWKNVWLYIQYALPGVFESNPHPNAVNGSLWTLPVEVLMYMLLLLLGMLRCLNTRMMACFLLVCWALYFRVVPALQLQTVVLLNNFPVAESAKLGCFFFGGAFLYLYDQSKLKAYELAMFALCAIVAVHGAEAQHAAYVVLAPFIVMALSFMAPGRFSQFGTHGDISYGIYIYAFPVQQTFVYLSGNSLSPLALFSISLPVTCVLAAISWQWIEKPALALKRHPHLLSLERFIGQWITAPLLPGKKQ